MARFIITFGQVHSHRVNNRTFDRDCVAVINSDSEEEARKIAFSLFGDKWHESIPEAQYDEEGLGVYFPRGKVEAN